MDDGKCDYSKPFAEQIDDWQNNAFPICDTFISGRTTDLWQRVDFAPLPVTLNQQHVGYMLKGGKDADHLMGEEFIKNLSEMIKELVAIIESKTKTDSALVVLIKYIHNDKLVIVPVYVEGRG